MNKRKAAGLTAGTGAAMLALSACSSVAPNPDVKALQYKAGSLSATSFKNCVDPGTRDWLGISDKAYEYPSGPRTYRFTDDGKGDTGPLQVAASTSSGGAVTLKTEGFVAFSLDVDCSPKDINKRHYPGGALQFFHEQVGLKNWGPGHAYIDNDAEDPFAGWGVMLDNNMGQPLQRAVNDASQGTDWAKLYNDPPTKIAWERKVKELLGGTPKTATNPAKPGYIEQAIGFMPFKIESVTIQKPIPPQNILDALAASEQARLENVAQSQKNAKIDTELRGIKSQIQLLGKETWLQKYAVDHGSVQILPIPQGSDVLVQPGK